MEMGHSLPPSMGVATAINFQPTGAGKAAITGDFVLRGSEVNPVIRAFKKNGIDVTALHSHLIDCGSSALLHALLGERRRAQAGARASRGARPDEIEALSSVRQPD